jgi:CheY-like chemotaxis protein
MSTVLVVDDDAVTRITVAALFGRNGCTVVQADDAKHAQEQLAAHAIDLIVCDFEMPGLNGGELRLELGADFPTPFVLLTGFGGAAEIAGMPGVDLVDSVVTKPIGSSSVSDLVDTFLSGRSGAEAA